MLGIRFETKDRAGFVRSKEFGFNRQSIGDAVDDMPILVHSGRARVWCAQNLIGERLIVPDEIQHEKPESIAQEKHGDAEIGSEVDALEEIREFDAFQTGIVNRCGGGAAFAGVVVTVTVIVAVIVTMTVVVTATFMIHSTIHEPRLGHSYLAYNTPCRAL